MVGSSALSEGGTNTHGAACRAAHGEGSAAQRRTDQRLRPRGGRLQGLRIAVDCANGAGYKVAPTTLYELGAEVCSVGVSPDGQTAVVRMRGEADLPLIGGLLSSMGGSVTVTVESRARADVVEDVP